MLIRLCIYIDFLGRKFTNPSHLKSYNGVSVSVISQRWRKPSDHHSIFSVLWHTHRCQHGSFQRRAVLGLGRVEEEPVGGCLREGGVILGHRWWHSREKERGQWKTQKAQHIKVRKYLLPKVREMQNDWV